METERERALRIAVAIAREHGVVVQQPVVLRELYALVAHLTPVPVVARVELNALFGPPAPWVESALSLSEFLATGGAAVAPPSDLLPPGPHEREGLVVSFWRYVENDPEAPLDAEAAGRSLAAIHELARSYTGDLPRFWPPREVEQLAARPQLAPVLGRADVALVRRRLDVVLATVPTGGDDVLHGDAHVGNCLRTADGPVWIDFDGACRGPLDWDAASMLMRAHFFGSHRESEVAYAAAFGDRYTEKELAPFVELRALLTVTWLALLAARRPELAPELEPRLAWLRSRDTR